MWNGESCLLTGTSTEEKEQIFSQANAIISLAFGDYDELQQHTLAEICFDGEDIIIDGESFDFALFATFSKHELDCIVSESNILAGVFKNLFEQSTRAFILKFKRNAKLLSLDGKAVQLRCEELNEEANIIRNRLNRMGRLVRALRVKNDAMHCYSASKRPSTAECDTSDDTKRV